MTEPPTLRAGRVRHQRRAKEQRRQQAIKRVTAYMRWCKSGGRMRDIPPIPSSADFKIARREQ